MPVPSARIRILNRASVREGADYVLYWMQQSQRSGFNPALELAVEAADKYGLPLVVAFGLTAYPEANLRHYAFMLQGLADAAEGLARRGIAFVIRKGSPDEVALDLSRRAAVTVCDRGYLRIQRAWRKRLADDADHRVVQVEGDVVVPVERASDKHEYAARTLRPKLKRQWEEFIQPLDEKRPRCAADDLCLDSDIDLSDLDGALAALDLDRSVGPVRRFRGGETEARRRLADYLEDGLARYGQDRGAPEARAASEMSPYLHFGQISPVEIALAVRQAKGAGSEAKAAYLEELIVRRELAMNHVLHEPAYDSYDSLPEWARRTLAAHSGDRRAHLYDRAQLEAGETHDPYWNAAMKEMRETGYMHNRLRMYWGKQVLAWSPSPEAAFETLLAINNRWFLDGRDANSFANVGWIFGLHDRPWAEREVFGTVRIMTDNSLKKFDADAYVAEVERLAAAETV